MKLTLEDSGAWIAHHTCIHSIFVSLSSTLRRKQDIVLTLGL